ncbi:MAG: pyridoxal-phosphate dependent enzyme, partial [Acidimicrobiia bacterium]|nr:pyridoxal-phosphate dependent enzyme [Acidimicrobiia bacterium]
DDPLVVAGQATLGIELIDDIPDLAQVIVPLGGGGLLSGVALTVKQSRPNVRVVGVQISSCAPYVYGKAPAGPVPTLADGIAVKVPGDVTAPLIERWVDDIVDVDEDSVADAMMLLLERAKFFVEGGGAVGVSALLTGRVKPADSGSTCVVLSGGNADLGLLTGLVRRHETNLGRRLIVFARISDRPGGLARLLALFAHEGANLIEVEHVREGVDLHVRETGVHAGGVVTTVAPFVEHVAKAADLVAASDGVLIQGGGDIDPQRYGDSRRSDTVYGIVPEHDDFEFAIVGEAVRQNKPLLAICRGLQVLNVALGGTLHQDVGDVLVDRESHWNTYHPISL